MALHEAEPKFNTEEFPEAAVRERVEELALRRGAEGVLRTFIDTTNVGDDGWGRRLLRQAIYKAVEGEERVKLYCKYVELGKGSIFANQASVERPRVKEAKAKGHEYFDQDSERKIESRVVVRQALWEKPLAESGDGSGRRLAKDGGGGRPCEFFYGERK